MRTFAQYLEDIATDFGREVISRGVSRSNAEVLSTLSKGVDAAAASSPEFARKVARMLVTASESSPEVKMALGSDFDPSSFVSAVVRAARSNAAAGSRNSPPTGDAVSPLSADAPMSPED